MERDGDGVRTPRASRRSLLVAASGAVAGAVGASGCLASADRIQVLAAASLAVALEEHLGPDFEAEHGVRFDGEYHGTNAILQMVETERKRPDVVLGVDVALLRERLYPDHANWDVEFASNEVGVVYEPSTELGTRLEAGEPWYDVLSDAEKGAVGIGDPDRSPVGYRAVHLFELAERGHEIEGFRETMVDRASVDGGDGQLLGGVEAGNRACAICYRSMAVDRDLPFYRLSDGYNFGNPERASEYERASYTTADGHVVHGSPVVYNGTVLSHADRPAEAERFVSFLLERTAPFEHCGLRVPDELPRTRGRVPGEVHQ
ncbi:extracellular solute-binding protein [Natrarchaeobius oligotrophus]|uniref:Sulfate ABC transporter substrate-binding protein n=1 Tax=Natrarchaeobius chitinivorans TaxID=1679083 RepID=A0A3N6MY63_NATCH|nr:extracellular solute-binding protein [Natrarchaeobius chitinivorans]RQH00007.1 sulfate ABC transporter substrate-binding protein [Natrarchaeobius chitinivorans]